MAQRLGLQTHPFLPKGEANGHDNQISRVCVIMKDIKLNRYSLDLPFS